MLIPWLVLNLSICCVAEDWSKQDEQTSANHYLPKNTTLLDLCRLFEVPLMNCSCEEKQVLCDILQTLRSQEIYVHACPLHVVRPRAIINLIGCSLSFLGNGLVILVTFKFWNKAGRFHKLIGFLAVVDFLFSCAQVGFSTPRLWTCKWLYGKVMCKVLSGIIDWLQIMAITLILIIAIERYFGIVHPLNNKVSKKGLCFLISSSWLMGLLFVTPIIYYTQVDRFQVCEAKWPSKTASLLGSWSWAIFFFLLPITTIAILYQRIMTALNKSMYKSGHLKGDYHLQKRLDDNKRVMKILVFVVVAFALLVFPNRIVWLFVDHFGASNMTNKVYEALGLFALVPYTLHVAINPVIYSVVDSKFRQRVLSIFSKHRVKNNSVTKRTNSSIGSTRESSFTF